MDITIRQATVADFEPIEQLLLEEIQYHADLLPAHFKIPRLVMTPQWLRGILANQGKALFVAEQASEIIGLVYVIILPSPNDPVYQQRNYAYVNDLAVTVKYRQQGVAQQLMHRVETWAKQQGVTEIELTVWESNRRAISFYEQLGYQTIKRTMQLNLTD